MQTIKIIDLYNNLANGKEVPKKIKYKEHNLIYDKEDMHDYIYISLGGEITCDTLLENIDANNLNDEVQILEDKPKKIDDFKLRNEKGEILIGANMWAIYYKLNELTQAVNYILEKSDKSE